jgi:hypothetical protein
MVTRRFVELLAACDPRTLTIVGYFLMLIRKVEKIWWLREQVDAEFRTVMKLLPVDWHPPMEWAIRDFEENWSKSPHYL